MRSKVHPKYKTKYRVGNWSAYEQALVQRGDVTLWLSADATDAWRPSHRSGSQHPLLQCVEAHFRDAPSPWARTATSYCSLVLDCDSRESQELACAVEAGYGDLPRPNVASQRAMRQIAAELSAYSRFAFDLEREDAPPLLLKCRQGPSCRPLPLTVRRRALRHALRHRTGRNGPDSLQRNTRSASG